MARSAQTSITSFSLAFSSSSIFLMCSSVSFWILSKGKKGQDYNLKSIEFDTKQDIEFTPQGEGAEQLDHRRWFSLGFGLLMIIAVISGFTQNNILSGLNINSINMLLFALALILYPNLKLFSNSVSKSIASSTGIMLQFPIYAGIMGVMKYSGLTIVFTEFFIQISTPDTFPLMAMLSAGIINFFVPSGGGQWAIQGSVLMEAAQNLNVSVPKTIMALAYGDELTNMLQPFWALPLLGITKLKAKEILPYSALIMLVGAGIFALAIFLFA